MKKINIQQDLDSRREIARMAYPAESVEKKENEKEVEPQTVVTDDKSKEETGETADKEHPGGKAKKNVRRRTSAGNA
ncbi:hypothetical protein [Bacteroides sp.]|uniref:hypothetical protein n=1 Tax=Bacteroides sp. TaxID=29523 RepID=UPI003A903E6E